MVESEIKFSIEFNPERPHFLTPRQQDLVREIVAGEPTADKLLASRLSISRHSVKNHQTTLAKSIELHTGELPQSKIEIILALISKKILVLKENET